ncbi:EAL domain-containing protein [Paraburkholderia elongata]|uniref:EAL domain-containing protein n=1 Tax=Paraburkholderia elongata TaxID=2675747 RepID=UPI0015527D33|nr:EAL domain-containing protein [Paraburkholderia elongata]
MQFSHSDIEGVVQRALADFGFLPGCTIAEGVEDEATLACLRRLECDEVQGYLMAKPMPEDQVAAFICEHAVCVSPSASPPESRGSLSRATGRA